MSILKKIILYYRYPNQLKADFFTLINTPKAKLLGVKFLPPNYLFFGKFNEKSVIIDVGCGYLAEFSCSLVQEYNLKAFGIDPTLKHQPSLAAIEANNNGRFKHIPIAITQQNGKINFHETLDHESGSVLESHQNILNDSVRTYEVESMNLLTLLDFLNLTEVDLIKLDLEGAEFELLSNISENDLKPFKQIFIEFHHLAVKDYSITDTLRIVKRIKALGFNSFSLDRVNFLFYK